MNKAAGLFLSALLVAGCAVGPNYKRPAIAAPADVRGQVGAAGAASFADRAWWDLFEDATLRELIGEALANGYDVRIAAARVEEARANAGIARSEFFPQALYQGQWARAQVSNSVVPGGPTASLQDVRLGLSWELDVWGRIRRSNEAALAQYLSTQDARRGVLLSLVAEVATQYFQLRALDEQLEIAKQTKAAFEQTHELFNLRWKGGIASALETSSAEASLEIVAARIPRLESQIVAQENAIRLLIGRNPGPIARGAPLNAQPVPPEIPPGLPSQLLERRPDLLAAEQQLAAANANVGVATANFFPVISLSAAFGGVNPDVSNLFHGGRAWSVAANMVGPLLQGARLKNQYDARVAQWQEAVAQYEKAVTAAFGEVSSSLVDGQKLVDAETRQARAVAAYQDAVHLANERYVKGLASYLDVLQAQQQLYPAENTLAQARFERLANFVQLYKALGGGWRIETPSWAEPAAAVSAARP